jgi:hypothetical protein
MDFLKRYFYFAVILFYLPSSVKASFLESDQLTEKVHPNITVKTIFSAKEISAEFTDNPQSKALISDWDLVVAGISNFDSSRFFRDPHTPAVYNDLMKQGVPVVVATARWLHGKSMIEHENYAEEMEKESGVKLSEQLIGKGKKLDLTTTTHRRGYCVQAITFTGSQKGPVVGRLLDHEESPLKRDHYVYVEDDPIYILQMIEVFKSRKETLTILHFPSIVHVAKRPAMLKRIKGTDLPLHARISYLIRHDEKEELSQSLADEETVKYIGKNSLNQHLVDLAYTNDLQTSEIFFKHVKYPFEELKPEELMQIAGNFYKKHSLLKLFIKKIPNTPSLLSLTLTLLANEVKKPIIEMFFEVSPHTSALLSDILFLAFNAKEDDLIHVAAPRQLKRMRFVTSTVLEGVYKKYTNLKEVNGSLVSSSFLENYERFKQDHTSKEETL